MSKVPFLPRFYPIIDTAALKRCGLEALPVAGAMLEAGAQIIQYRHKDPWEQPHFDEAKAIAQMCRASCCRFVLNDRADFAYMLGCDVHLGQDDLPVEAARKIVGNGVAIGFSTHNAEQLTAASACASDYLSIGPIFPTSSKAQPDPVVGLQGLRDARELTGKPLCAIGGIDMDQAADILRTGADSIALISALIPPSGKLQEVRSLAGQWISALRDAIEDL